MPNRISISLIYALAKKTNILQNDPILWFSMMLMPAGPPALVISGLAELAKISEAEEIAVAKTLTVSLLSLILSGSAVLMTRLDHVCTVASCMFLYYGGIESMRSCTGSEGLMYIIQKNL